jgi:hypothetical protein
MEFGLKQQHTKTPNALRVIRVIVCSVSLLGRVHGVAKNFSTRVVDQMGMPIIGATVTVQWDRETPDGKDQTVDLVNATTDARGIAKGWYPDRMVPEDQTVTVEITRAGYTGLAQAEPRDEFVLQKLFTAKDLDQVGLLKGIEFEQKFRELLASDFDGMDLGRRIFQKDSKFRPALLKLLDDPKLTEKAIDLLAFIAVPEDLRLIIAKDPAPKREFLKNRWAYRVASSVVEPTTDAEWEFLRKCACNDYEDGWVDAAGIQSLKFIASERSVKILEEARWKNKSRAKQIEKAIEYVRSKPPGLIDENLTRLTDRIVSLVKIGRWFANSAPLFNDMKDKACVDMVFVAGRDQLIYTATFHKEGSVWKFRGVSESMQALIAPD